jgi:uncharacterized protein with PQ loop repeat
MDIDKLQEGLGWLCCVFTILYYLAPTLPFLEVLKGKMIFEESPGVFVTTCYVNTFLWYLYGDMIFSDQIKYANMISACISLVLMVIYLIFELKKYLVDSILNALILITGTWAVYRALTIIIDDDRIVGKICFGTYLIVYLTPCSIVYHVIKEKNFLLIPKNSAIIFLIASVGWIVYGVLISDVYVVCSHVLGAIISLIQIIIFCNFKKKFPAIGEKDFSSTIGIETTGNEGKKEPEIKMDEDKEDKGKEKPIKIVNKMDD